MDNKTKQIIVSLSEAKGVSDSVSREQLEDKLKAWKKYSTTSSATPLAGANTVYKFYRDSVGGITVEIAYGGVNEGCLFYFRFACFSKNYFDYIHALARKYIGIDNITAERGVDDGQTFYSVEYTKTHPIKKVDMLSVTNKNVDKVIRFINESFVYVTKNLKG